ncbi:MAG: hypothetical protein H6667_10620 [Ardenticatenaceae bacterium]|nr:hypothetical protein [Ardenticatenaceae bacterium]
MEENNPVVLLSGDTWHIVEHSRKAKTALCGKAITDRRAHARYKQVGAANICPKCVKLFEGK